MQKEMIHLANGGTLVNKHGMAIFKEDGDIRVFDKNGENIQTDHNVNPFIDTLAEYGPFTIPDRTPGIYEVLWDGQTFTELARYMGNGDWFNIDSDGINITDEKPVKVFDQWKGREA